MQMDYFKDQSGGVWAYPLGTPETSMRPGLVQMTSQEVDEHLNPPQPAITAQGLKEIVTRYRWEVETGGITLPGGIKVATALDDQNRITTVVANARLAGLEQVKFKAASGWATLAVADVEGIAAAIALHVQACFAAECAHHDAIDAIALIEDPAERQAALDDYDETLGWPATQTQPAPAL